jgi:hypothetical protein
MTKEAMQSSLDAHSTFLDISPSTTADQLPHCAVELRRAETTTSASQLEAHLQAAPVEQFPENRDIVGQSASQVAHGNVPDDSRPNANAGADFIPTFTYGMKIVPCPEVTVLDVEHTHLRKTCFACP